MTYFKKDQATKENTNITEKELINILDKAKLDTELVKNMIDNKCIIKIGNSFYSSR